MRGKWRVGDWRGGEGKGEREGRGRNREGKGGEERRGQGRGQVLTHVSIPTLACLRMAPVSMTLSDF